MPCEVAVTHIHRAGIIREWTCIRRKWDISEGGVLRLRVGDAHGSTGTDEAEELRGEILVHSDAAVGARVMLEPASVEAVCRLEFTPIRHGSPLERPAGRTIAELGLFDVVAAVSVTVGVRASFCLFVIDGEVPSRGRGSRGADRDRHHEEYFGTLHDIGALFAERHFDFHVTRITRKLGRAVVCLISRKT